MQTIAVIGPGAIGGTIAGWLAQRSDLAVTLCARTPFEDLVVEAPGRRLTALLTVATSPVGLNPVDWVLVATKAYDTESVRPWLDVLVDEKTKVVVLRNGVEHLEGFNALIAPERLVPAIVDIPAERTAPGRILQRRNGWIKAPAGTPGEAFVALFDGSAIEASTTADFKTEAWNKLALNCAGAVNALLLKPAELAHDEQAADVMRLLVKECVAVGRAEGAALSDDLPDTVLNNYKSADPGSINSLHADRLAGRPMELDARNGVIVRLGEQHGVPTPANAMIVNLIAAATAQQREGSAAGSTSPHA